LKLISVEERALVTLISEVHPSGICELLVMDLELIAKMQLIATELLSNQCLQDSETLNRVLGGKSIAFRPHWLKKGECILKSKERPESRLGWLNDDKMSPGKNLWSCPHSRHQFVTANMWHSCGTDQTSAGKTQ
jgi:hypothetical protein